MDGSAKIESDLDFSGLALQTKTYHKRLNTDTEKVITETFTYDSRNRLLVHKHKIDTNAEEILAQNSYNEISQLTQKKVELRFTNPVNTSQSAPHYDGNIAEMDWISTGSNGLRRYSYRYDGLGRLKAGIFSQPNATVPENGYFNEQLTYDLNGNINTLKRNRELQYAGQVLMDDLSYVYSGNQLQTVTDGSGNYSSYPDVSGNLIHYDANGNMKDHQD